MKNIIGYEHYQIDEYGNVYNKKGKKRKHYINEDGYCRLGLSLNGHSKTFLLHRLVAINFIPNLSKLPHINHIDGNKENNHYSNLEWCTASENIIHAYKLGLIDNKSKNIGSKNGKSKLTEDIVRLIKQKIKNGSKLTPLTKEFNISFTVISEIKRGIKWAHVT